MKLSMKHLATTILSFTIAAVPAMAQQDSQRQNNRNDRQQSDQRDRQSWQSDRQDEASSNRASKNRSSGKQQIQVDPRGWVSTAVDYNNDGTYDAVETIYIYDLERAQRSSRQRKSEEQRQASSNRRSDRQQRTDDGESQNRQRMSSDRYESDRDRSRDNQSRDRNSQQQQMVSVTGKIDSMKSVKLAGMDDRHQLAKVETRDGKRLAICLGTEQELSRLDLSEGDQIEVRGQKSRINDRTVLMARKVSHDGQSVSPASEKPAKTKRVKAEVKQTRTVNFRNIDEPHLIARVETQSGKTETVNMGPKAKYSDVDLREGTQVKLLVRQGRINGKDALIAQEANIDNETVKLPRPQDRKRFSGGRVDNRDRDRGRSHQRDDDYRRYGTDDRR